MSPTSHRPSDLADRSAEKLFPEMKAHTDPPIPFCVVYACRQVYLPLCVHMCVCNSEVDVRYFSLSYFLRHWFLTEPRSCRFNYRGCPMSFQDLPVCPRNAGGYRYVLSQSAISGVSEF